MKVLNVANDVHNHLKKMATTLIDVPTPSVDPLANGDIGTTFLCSAKRVINKFVSSLHGLWWKVVVVWCCVILMFPLPFLWVV
jgi:hypothetical protein